MPDHNALRLSLQALLLWLPGIPLGHEHHIWHKLLYPELLQKVTLSMAVPGALVRSDEFDGAGLPTSKKRLLAQTAFLLRVHIWSTVSALTAESMIIAGLCLALDLCFALDLSSTMGLFWYIPGWPAQPACLLRISWGIYEDYESLKSWEMVYVGGLKRRECTKARRPSSFPLFCAIISLAIRLLMIIEAIYDDHDYLQWHKRPSILVGLEPGLVQVWLFHPPECSILRVYYNSCVPVRSSWCYLLTDVLLACCNDSFSFSIYFLLLLLLLLFFFLPFFFFSLSFFFLFFFGICLKLIKMGVFRIYAHVQWLNYSNICMHDHLSAFKLCMYGVFFNVSNVTGSPNS